MKQLEDELLEKQEEIRKLKEMCTTKDKKIEELELEVLRLTTRIADMITEHSQELQKLTSEISKLKVSLLVPPSIFIVPHLSL